MPEPPNVLAVIPARGGSKGVPHKNVRCVGGKPLIAYTIETALAAGPLLRRVVVSTDSVAIAEVARRHGAEVPFMRPAALAGDHVPMLPVVQHAVRHVEADEGRPFDWVCLLQPTNPLRLPEDVEAAIGLAQAGGCDSVISVVQVFAEHPILMKRIDDEGFLAPFCIEEREGTRRQDYAPPAYKRDGALYLTRRDVLMEQGSIWGRRIRPYVMPPERGVGIDTPLDLRLVELLLQERQAAPTPANEYEVPAS